MENGDLFGFSDDWIDSAGVVGLVGVESGNESGFKWQIIKKNCIIAMDVFFL